MRAIDKYKKIQELNKITVPWEVWTMFESDSSILHNYGIEIRGEDIDFGGDMKKLPQVKENLDWLVEQFGGVVCWDVE